MDHYPRRPAKPANSSAIAPGQIKCYRQPPGREVDRGYDLRDSEAMEFDWDAANEDHVARHGLTREEVEEACTLEPMEATVYSKSGEVREGIVRKTFAGRILFVVYVRRGQRIRVVTAYPATKARRALYRLFIAERHHEQ